MITPSFGLTATERVLPRLALDWTTGLAQPGVDVTRAGTATYIDSNGVLQVALADTQRVDYSTGTSGLLVEESRRNAIFYSNKFDEAIWDKRSGGTGSLPVLTPNSGISPDGTNNAWRFLCDRGAGNTTSDESFMRQRCFLDGGVSPANPHDTSVSIWAKSNTGVNQTVYFRNATGSGASTIVVTPEWKRFPISASVAATVEFFNIGSRGTFGNNVVDILIYGAQLEFALFPTSYIPTEATAVTRNADVATMTGTNFSDWFNASEGTFFARSSTYDISGNRGIMAIGDPTLAFGSRSTIYANYSSTRSGRIALSVANAGVAQVNDLAPTYTEAANQFSNAVFGYKEDAFALGVNGNALAIDSAGTVPPIVSMSIGNLNAGWTNGGNFLNGHIGKLMYWPYRLTNAEIQAFSK